MKVRPIHYRQRQFRHSSTSGRHSRCVRPLTLSVLANHGVLGGPVVHASCALCVVSFLADF